MMEFRLIKGIGDSFRGNRDRCVTVAQLLQRLSYRPHSAATTAGWRKRVLYSRITRLDTIKRETMKTTT